MNLPTIIDQSDGQIGAVMRLVEHAIGAGVMPKGMTKDQAFIVIQSAMELDIKPMQALRTMHVIDGRLTLSAQAMLALVMRGGNASIVYHTSTSERCDLTLTRGASSIRICWTEAEARACGRWGKGGPWSQYPQSMLRSRAIADACRAIAPDLLAGMYDPDEIRSEAAPMPVPVRVSVPALPGGALVTDRSALEAPADEMPEPGRLARLIGALDSAGILASTVTEHGEPQAWTVATCRIIADSLRSTTTATATATEAAP